MTSSLSTTSFLRALDVSFSMRSLSTAAVESLSSQVSTGTSAASLNQSTNFNTNSVCALELPSILRGSPATIFPTEFSLAISSTPSMSLASCVLFMVETGCAISPSGSLNATPMVFLPMSRPITLILLLKKYNLYRTVSSR